MKLYFYLFAILSFSACSARKVVPKGDYLYTGAKVKVRVANDSISKGNLTSTLSYDLYPKPNRKVLGMRWKLRIYSFFNPKKETGWRYRMANKYGEAPVLYSQKTSEEVEQLLENKAYNNGYFYTTTSHEVRYKKWRRRAKVKYYVTVEAPFVLKKISYQIDAPEVSYLLRSQRKRTRLKLHEPYRLNDLKSERQGLTAEMRKRGYYYFSEDILEFVADTAYAERGIHLMLKLKENTPPEALRKYHLGEIEVRPDYELSTKKAKVKQDTFVEQNLRFIYRELNLKSNVIRQAIALNSGDQYDPKIHQITLERLSNLNTYKYISVRFEPSPKADTLLNVKVLLTPKIKRTVEGEFGVSLKSSLYFGPEIKLNYIDRNLFRGAENLRITTAGLFNFPLEEGLAYSDRIELNMRLNKPSIWTPFNKWTFDANLVGQTRAIANFKREKYTVRLDNISPEALIDLPELEDIINATPEKSQSFNLNQVEFSYGYNWRKQAHLRHALTPFRIGYQFSNLGQNEVDRLSEIVLLLSLFSSTPELALTLEKMLYFQPDYVFLLDTRQKRVRRDNYLFRGRFALAGNRLFERENSFFTRADFESYYLQFEPDFRYLALYNHQNQLAARFAAGLTVPFNEKVILPFFSLYSVGGSTSVRAFAPRTVGPGSRNPEEQFVFPFLGIGDVRIEGNLEYRQKITPMFEAAIFADAGNVWRIWADGDTEQATFQFNRFYKQFAVGTGLGLRIDLDFLLVRLDLATPVLKPWRAAGDRFVLDEITLGNKEWRKENLVLNFAFGYPF